MYEDFLKWWNENHDWAFGINGGEDLYEKHALKCFKAGWEMRDETANQKTET